MYRQTNLQQHVGEIDAFVALCKRENVRRYLEIGSKFGGSLWRVGKSLPLGSSIVSVDLPHGDRSTLPHLEHCLKELCETFHHSASLLVGDSTDPQIVSQVRARGRYDMVLIDANHTLPYVTMDFQNYSSMTRLIAFHDINWKRPIPPGRMPIEVRQFWDEVKQKYRHEEIIMCEKDNGIGVLWL